MTDLTPVKCIDVCSTASTSPDQDDTFCDDFLDTPKESNLSMNELIQSYRSKFRVLKQMVLTEKEEKSKLQLQLSEMNLSFIQNQNQIDTLKNQLSKAGSNQTPQSNSSGSQGSQKSHILRRSQILKRTQSNVNNLPKLQEKFGGKGLTVAGVPYYRLIGEYNLKISRDITLNGNISNFEVADDDTNSKISKSQIFPSQNGSEAGTTDANIELTLQIEQRDRIIQNLQEQIKGYKQACQQHENRLNQEVLDLKQGFLSQLAALQESNNTLQKTIENLEISNLELQQKLQSATLEAKATAQQLNDSKNLFTIQKSELIVKNQILQKEIQDSDLKLELFLEDLLKKNATIKLFESQSLELKSNQSKIDSQILQIKNYLDAIELENQTRSNELSELQSTNKSLVQQNYEHQSSNQSLKQQVSILKLKIQQILRSQMMNCSEIQHQNKSFLIASTDLQNQLKQIECKLSLACNEMGQFSILISTPMTSNIVQAKQILDQVLSTEMEEPSSGVLAKIKDLNKKLGNSINECTQKQIFSYVQDGLRFIQESFSLFSKKN